MFCLHKATSAVSCVKPSASQWEARLCDDVRFLTVYRRIYHRRLFHWMQLSPFKCICSFFYWKNVLFAQSNKCCELCKTKCQPMTSVMWWRWISDSISQNIPSQIFFVIQSDGRPWWLSWIRIRLETRRSQVQPPLRLATFFRGDWWWNIFYGHSLPSADSRRADVSFWRKNVHNTG